MKKYLTAKEIMDIIENVFPTDLAEEWDNVGFLAGRGDKEVKTVLCALDYSPEVLTQALEKKADMIITHHPVIFKALKSITDKNPQSVLIMEALRHDIVLYSAHTNLDSAAGGVNDVLARLIGLENIRGLNSEEIIPAIGRLGELPECMKLKDFATQVKKALPCSVVTYADAGKAVRKVAVCSGSGMDFIDEALAAGADTFVTGDVKYHEAQAAVAQGINVIDGGHQGTELPAVPALADRLAFKLNDEGYGTKILVAEEKYLFEFIK